MGEFGNHDVLHEELSTMGEAIEGMSHAVERVGVCFVVDCSGSVARYIDAINRAVRGMYESIREDVQARMGVDIAVVSFGECNVEDAVNDHDGFRPIERAEVPTLAGGGYTPLNEALIRANCLVRDYNHALQAEGIPHRKPIIVVVSDFYATDDGKHAQMLREVADSMNRGSNGHLAVWCIGVGEFNESFVRDLLPDKWVFKLDSMQYFENLTEWIAKNTIVQSRTRVGQAAEIPALPDGMSIPSSWFV